MTAALRDNVREIGHQIRTKHRCANFNRARETDGLGLGLCGHVQDSIEIILPAQVTQLVQEIKVKSRASLQELRFLQLAFISRNGRNNIDAFLSVTGALNILIKELSGKNASLQLAAANCCCNLALGNEKQCEIVAKASAPYLITHLQSANMKLVDICAWTIGNLAASGPKALSILSGQGAGVKLADLLSSPDIEIVHSVIYALNFYVKTGGDTTSCSDAQTIAKSAACVLKNNTDVCWLLFLLSSHPACDDVFLSNKDLLPSAVEILASPAKHGANLAAVTALLRVVGNVCGMEDGRGAHLVLDSFHQLMVVFLELLLAPHQHLRQEVMWVMTNIINHPREDIRIRVAEFRIREQLEVKLQQLHIAVNT